MKEDYEMINMEQEVMCSCNHLMKYHIDTDNGLECMHCCCRLR